MRAVCECELQHDCMLSTSLSSTFILLSCDTHTAAECPQADSVRHPEDTHTGDPEADPGVNSRFQMYNLGFCGCCCCVNVQA